MVRKRAYSFIHLQQIRQSESTVHMTVSCCLAPTVASKMRVGLRRFHSAGICRTFSTSECGLSDRISNVSSMTLGYSCPPCTLYEILSDRLLQQGLSAFCCVKNKTSHFDQKGFKQHLRVVFKEKLCIGGGGRGGRKSRFYPLKIKLAGELLHHSRKHQSSGKGPSQFLTFGNAAA